jgi:hypothetical protein
MSSTLSPETLAVYRATARRREQERADRRRTRRESAWHTAREAAAVLRREYGVGRIVAFGSLVEDRGRFFSERSDIDLGAAGLTVAVHLTALGHLLRLSSEFEFDLIDLERCPEGLREAILAQGVEL